MLDFLKFDSGVIVVFAAIVILALLFAYLGSRYKVAGANEALIRSGRATPLGGGEAGLKVVRGQGIVVLPLFHKIGKLKLTARQINVQLTDAVTRQGIKVAVQGVATFKIGADDESIRNAAERFLDAQEDQVDSIVKNVLEGSLRSIVGTLTVEELNLDRQKFQQAVQDAAKGDLATSGLQIDSFTIQAIRDESGYMELIGQQETARRERDARMAKATADQEAAVREAEANQVKINAERDVALRRAETETQIAAAEARAAQSGPLAQAEATQEVVKKQTELAELEAARKQQELVASTVRPAEAEADAAVKRAEGEKLARIAQAQADAERVKLAGQAEAAVNVTKGEANARVILVNAQSEAEKTKLEGNAEAGIVFTKGEAEAKALALRAEAYRQFNEAAIIQTVLSMLPEIVRAAAEPMAAIDSMTVLSTEGASDVVKNATRTVTEASTAVKGLTGLDIPGLISGAIRGDAGRGGGGGGGGGEGGSGGGGGGSAGRGRSPRPSGPAPSPAPAGAAGAAPTGSPTTTGARAASASRQALADARAIGDSASLSAVAATEIAAKDVADARAAVEAGEAATQAAMARVDASVRQAGARVGQALRSTPTAAEAAAASAPGAAGIGRDTTVNVAAQRLARDLAAIPGIERFGSIKLGELDRAGPRPLRTMWRIARGQLADRYGEMTIGEMVDRFGGGGPAARA
ncbi:MAG TPA: SPFH domain-containing protein [Candidatus Limnocylindrales bacterium]|nr:SPFH domain-containing protein [Candidatus Limnocylindrales bacterium]